MALRQLVGLALTIIFTSKGCNASSDCGIDGSEGNWPWQVSITLIGGYVCGGTLITDEWVLTTAKCTSWWPDAHLVVYLGSTLFANFIDSKVSREVDFKICHPDYNNYSNDICLLKLSAPVALDPSVRPICLAAQGSTFYTGVKSWVGGWNSWYNDYHSQFSYQELNTTAVGPKECSCRRSDATLPNTSLCAAIDYYTSLHSYGLPLLVKKDSVLVQIGILSTTCWYPEPCVFTDVSKFQDWITNVTTNYNSTSTPGFVEFTSTGEDSDLDFDCNATYAIYNKTYDNVFSSGVTVNPNSTSLLILCGLYFLYALTNNASCKN